ncbi:MAG: excinuclease ABC subunit A [Rhodothermales bacterium]|jgi:excinuclease ABC subunit A
MAKLKSKRVIRIQGARQHNLKNVDVTLPHDALIVITGPSGSGKSSLAFDTLYAEGQRRYVESLSAYARQFLDQMQKPNVDHIEGLSPAIAIEQRSAGGSPRSIVATTTEIYDYLRLLYAHVGHPHCPGCKQPVSAQSPQRICDHLLALQPGLKMMLLAPYVRGRKGNHKDVFEAIRKDGWARVRVNGEIRSLDDDITLEKNLKHNIEAVVDRLKTGKLDSGRLADSVERTLRCGDGMLLLMLEDSDTASGWSEELISEHFACTACNISFGELQPRNFSFNSPYGACSTCHGLGTCLVVDPDKAVIGALTLNQGAFPLWRVGMRRIIQYNNHHLRCVSEHYGFSLDVPFNELAEEHQDILMMGSGDEELSFRFRWGGKMRNIEKTFEGLLGNLMRRYNESESKLMRDRLRAVMDKQPCPTCDGARLRPASLGVTVSGMPIHHFLELSVSDALSFVENLKLEGEEELIAREILREVRSRLGFLNSVGLNYLSLNRESMSLSGGEAQRIRLATQVGSGLVGVLYVLDEPSIGLHQRDNRRLLDTLISLRDIGNTVVVVEHDLDTINSADFIVDIGPGAGQHGGEIVYSGPPAKCKKSLTGKYLTGALAIALPETRKSPRKGRVIAIRGASANNLQKVDVDLPLGVFCCVTGVSGSGKSTLVHQVLGRAVKEWSRLPNRERPKPRIFRGVSGLEQLSRVITVDQKPIGRTPRSNPLTYTGAFDLVREIFAKVPESRVRGYKPGRFSFNVKGGRCADCKGDGIKKIEMQFLPDVYVPCDTCKGKRYNDETLTIRYKGLSIADVLAMTVRDGCDFFKAIPKIQRILQTLDDVGLGYLHLGQPATTLSGGEAQRVKLSTELSKSPRGHTLYILDEPTTGLHIDDVHKLLEVLFRLRDRDSTVLVIEHNLDVVKTCDHIIDLGPEGGDGGGKVVAIGTPEEVANSAGSFTGEYLGTMLK